MFMRWLCALTFIVFFSTGFSQTPVGSYCVQVSMGRTTNIIFPYGLKSVDRGSRDFIVQKAKGVENILQLKANKVHFPPTNLTVVTADGKFYSFMVSFSDEPYPLNLSFCRDTAILLTGGRLNDAILDSMSRKITGDRAFLHISNKEEDIKISLTGLYVNHDLLWFRFSVRNQSPTDFKPSLTRFILKDRNQAKRTAMHESTLQPLFQTGLKTVTAGSEAVAVFAFDPFPIPKDRRLEFFLSEENEGRALTLRVGHRSLRKAHTLLP
jgi:conjugative transposon TraN protein